MTDNIEYFLKRELKENMRDVTDAGFDSCLFRSKNIVELTFEFCEKLHLSAPTRYLALEVFDQFMPKFLIESREKCQQTNQSWDDISAVIERQVPMRILSCIQLASKYSEKERRLKPEQIVSILSCEAEKYGLRTVLNSEMRVFQTVGFSVRLRTALDTIETLLGALSRRCAFSAPDQTYWLEQSVAVLDLVMFNWRVLFEKLRDRLLEIVGLSQADVFGTVHHPATVKMKLLWKQIEMDRMLMAGSVITVVANRSSSLRSSGLLGTLSNLCEAKMEHLTLFADIISLVCL